MASSVLKVLPSSASRVLRTTPLLRTAVSIRRASDYPAPTASLSKKDRSLREPPLNTAPAAPQHLPDVTIIDHQPPPRPRPSDSRFLWTMLGLILITPPTLYFYYEHRREHMDKKRVELIKHMEERRKEFLARNR